MRQLLRPACLLLILLFTQLASVQAAYCNEIWVDADKVTVERNDVEYFYFPISNESDEDFLLYEAEAWRETGDFEISIADYPTRVRANGEGELTIRVETGSLDSTSYGSAYIRLRGMFEEGKYCGFTQIDTTYFDVTVEKDQSQEDCRDIEIDAFNVIINENSTKTASFSIKNNSGRDFELYGISLEENSSYFSATVYNEPSFIDAYERENFTIRIESENVSSDKEGTATLEARGRFENGEYCSQNEIPEERFTVFVENRTGPTPGQGCDEIYLDAGTIRVEKGSTEYATIYLENETSEDFYVDYVSVFDSSPNIRAEENGYAKTVPSYGSSYVNVKIQAFEYAETGRQEALVEVRGHFQNGNSCYLFPSNVTAFSVIVEEPYQESLPTHPQPTAACSQLSLIAPETAQIGKSGQIPITIDNRTGARASISLYGPGLTVQPKMISVPKNTLVSEMVSVSTVLPETTLVYTVNAAGCTTTQRTSIISTETAQQPQETEEEGIDSISAGFVVLGQATAALGLIVLAIIAAYLIFRP